jgi:type VI secretion system secreted protein Hcp
MAVDIFLKLGDIKGESVVKGHEGSIEIESFSFGQAANATQDTGQRTGKVELQDYSFVMPINVASPTLMTYCADGRHLLKGGLTPDATLTLRKGGTTPVDFVKIRFFDVMLSSFQAGGAKADLIPTDQFSLWFGKIELGYYQQSPTGQLLPPVFFRWDRIKGESWT